MPEADAPLTQDGELMAAFAPRQGKFVLVLEFSTPEALFQAQEAVMAMNRRFDEEGRRLPEQAQTLAMGRALVGRKEMFGRLEATLVAHIKSEAKLTEQARRDWFAQRSMREAPVKADVGFSESWMPSTELLDNLERWDSEVVEEHPAGGSGPRVKTGAVRKGYNAFCRDIGRPELQLQGSPGGRIMSGFVQSRHQGVVRVAYQGSNAYFHGLQRKDGAKQEWFPNLPFSL